MSEHQEGNLSNKFYRLASFALIMTSLVIFFGTIYLGVYYTNAGIAKGLPPEALKVISTGASDFALKGILTAIFTMMFAVVFMLNDLIRVLEKQK